MNWKQERTEAQKPDNTLGILRRETAGLLQAGIHLIASLKHAYRGRIYNVNRIIAKKICKAYCFVLFTWVFVNLNGTQPIKLYCLINLQAYPPFVSFLYCFHSYCKYAIYSGPWEGNSNCVLLYVTK